MQLSKLRKNTHRQIKNRERLKYLSLGVILPACTPLNSQQLTKKLVDMDSCLHMQNSSQVLMADITDQLPDHNSRHQKVNKLFAYFIRRIKQKETQEVKIQEDQQRVHKSKDEDVTKVDASFKKVHNKDLQIKHIAIVADQITRIYEEADKKHEIKKFKIAKLQKQLEKLYIESHDLYIQLMKIKQSIEAEASEFKNTQEKISQDVIQQNDEHNSPRLTRNKALSEIAVQNPQYVALGKKIAKIKENIQKKEEEHKNIVELEKPLAKQKTEFLKLLLKKGYNLPDGIWWLLVKLAKDKQILTKSDFYDVLDSTTKDRLLLEYDLIKRDLFRTKGMLPWIRQSNPDAKQMGRKSNEIIHRLMSIPLQSNSKHIYRDTQDYIVDWVRKQRWKVRSLKHKTTIEQEITSDWSIAQVRRLKHTYPKEVYQQMLIYIFGSVKYCHKLPVSRLQEFLSTRRHKDSSNSPDTIRSSQRGNKSISSQLLSRNNTNK